MELPVVGPSNRFLVAERDRRWPHVLSTFLLLAVLVVDVQTDWITTWGLRLLLNVALFGTLAAVYGNEIGLTVAALGVGVVSWLPSRNAWKW